MIEKAFAIDAEPDVVWEGLWSDLSQGDPALYEVEQAQRPRRLVLRLTLGGIPARLTYEISRRDGGCEVAARLEPLGPRFGFYQILTFGHTRTNLELTLVQSLANLKASVESV